MTKPSDLSQADWNAAEAALDLMPSHGVQMRHHRIENIARAIMAEREACAVAGTAEVVERVARALCARHYAARFDKAEDDEHVLMNVNAGWHIFKGDAIAAIGAMSPPHP